MFRVFLQKMPIKKTISDSVINYWKSFLKDFESKINESKKTN